MNFAVKDGVNSSGIGHPDYRGEAFTMTFRVSIMLTLYLKADSAMLKVRSHYRSGKAEADSDIDIIPFQSSLRSLALNLRRKLNSPKISYPCVNCTFKPLCSPLTS